MNFARTDDQRMLADSLDRLLAEHNGFEARRARLGGPQPDRLALWPALAELGVIGTAVAEADGGFGGTMRDLAVVMAAFGRTLSVEPYLATALVAGILAGPAAPAARESLAAALTAERVTVFAPGPGVDPFGRPALAARAETGGWRVWGDLPVVRHADLADALVVAATLPNDTEIGCFLIDTADDGVAIEPFRLIDAASAGHVVLRGAQAVLIASGSAAEAAVLEALERGVVGAAAEAVAIMRALNVATFAYLGTRKQFGVTLASFQALQHRAADLHIAAEEAEIMTERAIDRMAEPPGPGRSALVSGIKVLIDTAGRKIGHDAVQLHGGMGVSDELMVSHYLRRLAAIRAELGSADLHRARFLTLSTDEVPA